MLSLNSNKLTSREYFKIMIDTAKESLLMMHRISDLLSASESTDKRDFVYYFHIKLNVSKEKAVKMVDKCLYMISTLCGLPRCLLPIIPTTKIYVLGQLVINQGSTVILNVRKGYVGILNNTIPGNLFIIQKYKGLLATRLSFHRIILVEKANMTKIFRLMSRELVKSSLSICYHGFVTMQIRCPLKQIQIWMQEQHSRKLFEYGKFDNNIYGLQYLLSYIPRESCQSAYSLSRPKSPVWKGL